VHWTDARHPLWRRLLLGCALATALPLWLYRYLPFTDLPQHAAMIGTLRHFSDPAWSSPYTLALGQTQYLLYYLAGALLAFPFGSAERANLVLLTAVAIGLPYALRSLLRAIDADERCALFAPALFWNESLIIGFFTYLAALPILLWALSLAVKIAEKPTRRSQIQLAVLAVVLFYLHLSAFAFFGLCAGLALLALPGSASLAERLRSIAPRALWAAPVAVLMLLWLLTSPVVHPGQVGWNAPVAASWEPLGDALRGLPAALLDIWRGQKDELAMLALVGCGALLALPQARPAEPAEAARRRSLVAVWALLAGALYFAMPVSIGWLWALNHRYAIATALLLPALLRPAPGLRGALPLLGAAAVALFSAGVAADSIRAFQAEVGPFDEVLAQTQPGKRLLALIYDRGSSVAGFAPFLHFGSYYRARSGGIAEFSFSELPQSPLRYREGVVPPRRPPRWEWMPDTFRNDRDGPFYDYLLVRGNADPVSNAPGPHWTLVSRGGPWRLWARQ
jgi:hypothetical protein